MKTLGVGVIGLGVGEQHARAFAALAGQGRCALRWLCDLELPRARAAAERLGAERATDRWELLVEDPAVDVVAVASYDDAHAEQIVRALSAGKHVFAEKPLCTTSAELREIHGAWQRQRGRLWLASNLVLRAAPLYAWLRDQIQSGAFGRLYALDADYLYGRLEKLTDGWRGRVKDYSVLLGGGIHMVDLALWLSGERPVAVRALGNRICTEGTSFAYRDFAAASFEFRSGLVARVTANFGCVHPHQHALRVFGTRRSLLYDDAGPRLHEDRDARLGARPVRLAALPASKGELVSGFVEGILRGDDPAPLLREHLASASACLAAERALQSGERVEVEYP